MARRRPRIYRVTLDTFYLFEDLNFRDSKPPPVPDPQPGQRVELVPGERPFSFMEEQVIKLLSHESPLRRADIATKLRVAKMGVIRGLLSNLCERDVLELTKRGYVLGPGRRDQQTPPQAG